MEANGNSFFKFSVFASPFNTGHPLLYRKLMAYAQLLLTAVFGHVYWYYLANVNLRISSPLAPPPHAHSFAC